MVYADSITDLSETWGSVAGDSTFMQEAFYRGLEAAPPSGTAFRYAIIYDDMKPAGVIYLQLKTIDLSKSLRFENVKKLSWTKRQYTRLKQFLAKQIKYNTLVIGNMTLTGNYGHHFTAGYSQKWQTINQAADKLVDIYRKEGTKVNGILLKDFNTSEKPQQLSGYAHFQVQPNMAIKVPDHWHSFDDYIADMKSKYKVRVRRARKKAADLHKIELTAEQILHNKEHIAKLYTCVADGAGFNLFELPENYFYSLKKELDDDMKLTAYYNGDTIVGFYTSIKNHGELDAHFLGYDPDTNYRSQLYLNMLYDLVEEAVEQRCSRLVMSRTALEIKSSVGATAEPMHLYVKATNSLVNKVLPRALEYFIPAVQWQPRSPFK